MSKDPIYSVKPVALALLCGAAEAHHGLIHQRLAQRCLYQIDDGHRIRIAIGIDKLHFIDAIAHSRIAIRGKDHAAACEQSVAIGAETNLAVDVAESVSG